MHARRPVARWIASALLVALALASAGCSWSIHVMRSASCPGLQFDAVERVLRGDPSLEGVAVSRHGDTRGLSCWRGGERGSVNLGPPPAELRVFVSRHPASGRAASADEARLWTEQIEYVTGKLSAACPEIGSWA